MAQPILPLAIVGDARGSLAAAGAWYGKGVPVTPVGGRNPHPPRLDHRPTSGAAA